MNRTRFTVYPLVLVLAVGGLYLPAEPTVTGRLAGLWSAVAWGQPGTQEQTSQDQAKDAEITRLREQVAALEAELADAQARIAELEDRLGLVRPDDPVLSSDPMVILDDRPMASPDAMLKAIQDSYAEITDGLTHDGERDRALYLRRLRQWITRIDKEFTGPVEWVVELVRFEQTGERTDLAILVVRDAETGYRLSRDFDIPVTKRLSRRLIDIPAGALLELHGIMRCRLNLNEARPEVGPFNEPRFVGAFVEYDYEITIQSLTRLEIIPWEQVEIPEPEDGSDR
ncbi:MAG: hypothetical protein D8M59_00020 [Planctomycetes bacterium]|nr:hypothetical protein [Planctomycetota bacterium]NOG56080.1 hypothetical protein [Planctomycetota bacterium]